MDPIGCLVLDQNRVICGVNAGGSQLFGAERKSLLGKPFLFLVEKESQDIYRQHHQHVFETGESGICELKLLKGEGYAFHASIAYRALSNIKGNISHFAAAVTDISERIAAEKKLQEMRIALKVLINEREEDRIAMEKQVLSNIRELVMPYLDKLKHTRLDEHQAQCLQLIQANIEKVNSSFSKRALIHFDNLTSREAEIIHLVKDGHATKGIASLLCVSTRSVEFHKDNIRRKMGLTNKAIGLQSYLRSL